LLDVECPYCKSERVLIGKNEDIGKCWNCLKLFDLSRFKAWKLRRKAKKATKY